LACGCRGETTALGGQGGVADFRPAQRAFY
jgi:hypothetical protein